MPDIKTREIVKDVKVIDKAAVAGERMRNAFIRTKDQTQNLMDDGQASPSEYAEDKIRYAVEDTASEVGREVKRDTKKIVEKTRKANQQRKEAKRAQEQSKESPKDPPKDTPKQPSNEVKQPTTRAKQTPDPARQAERGSTRIRRTQNRTIKTSQQSAKTIKQTAKSTGQATAKTAKGTIKTAEKGVKTAQQTSKAAVKTAEATAKATKAAAEATAKAAKAAAHAARVAAKAIVAAAKVAAKAIAAAAKAVAAAIKGLVAAIAAGGWVAVVIIVVICLIGALIACFGIFFSSEDTGGEKTMQMVVQEINQQYQEKLDGIKSSVTYDELEMSGSMAVWPEVLSIYSVKVTSDPDNPQEVATITDEKEQILRDIFWEMNVISHTVSTEEVTEIIETDDGEGNIIEEEIVVTKTTLHIVVTHKTADDMASQYNFNADQQEHLDALLEEGTASMWASVLYGVYGEDDQIVAVAISQIGNVGGMPYWSWYGFGSRVAWCACFVSWCANECGYIDIGVIPKFAGCVNGVNWFKTRGQWADGSFEPAPGMIIFFDWDSPNGESGPQDGLSDHVGIVEKVENGRVYTIEGNTSDSCARRSYPLGYYEILGYGIPAY